MSITLDGQSLFDEYELKIEAGSFSRDSIERASAGLDGVVSIDLGSRSRQIKQQGVLRSKSRSEMDERVSVISACMNGDTHILAVTGGAEFSNLRMDSFRVTNDCLTGSGVVIDYEIIYTQLSE